MIEMCLKVINNPYKKEIQANGKIRYWVKIEKCGGTYLRVVLFENGETIHNAFFDRGFKP